MLLYLFAYLDFYVVVVNAQYWLPKCCMGTGGGGMWCTGSLKQGQKDLEGRPLAWCAGDGDGTTMSLDDAVDD
jgi:hypothetical protein